MLSLIHLSLDLKDKALFSQLAVYVHIEMVEGGGPMWNIFLLFITRKQQAHFYHFAAKVWFVELDFQNRFVEFLQLQ